MKPSSHSLSKQTEQVMQKSFVVNFSLIVLKIVTGFLFKSSALIADGIHSLSDFLSDIFVIIGIRHSAKPADEEHPFGHGKFEYVISIFIGVSILFLSYQLITNVISNIREEASVPSVLTLIVATSVIVIKLLLSKYLLSKSERLDSQVLRSSGKESLSDVISSLVVFIGAGLGILGGTFNIGWLLYADSVAALLIGLFIIKVGIEIIVEAVQLILGKSAKAPVLKATKIRANSVKGVIKVDHLDMIMYGHYFQVMIDIRVNGSISVKEGHDIAHEVKKVLQKDERICHVIVHVNPDKE